MNLLSLPSVDPLARVVIWLFGDICDDAVVGGGEWVSGGECGFVLSDDVACWRLPFAMTIGEFERPKQRIRQASWSNWRRACLRHLARRF